MRPLFSEISSHLVNNGEYQYLVETSISDIDNRQTIFPSSRSCRLYRIIVVSRRRHRKPKTSIYRLRNGTFASMLTSASAYYDNRASYDRLKQYRGDEGRGEGRASASFPSEVFSLRSRVTRHAAVITHLLRWAG